MDKNKAKLEGKALASYLEEHRNDFNGNGDALCLAAGYGIQGDDGTEKCDFSDFVKALSTAIDVQSQ
ncbi:MULTISPECIES: hypothetical protein [unclassified Prochlorococcus]|uniref:hypothetical protein n=1 Tax=unclassified Prochlorococcus TaxID=2627481 RepID=UPI0005338BC1|nr:MULTISPECIES: hypothetical protein [unclassified Prochlorococcus]KGG15510.1 hypothetical protein EV06_1384 [Prochlorococcus sp. MIT 0602]KGG17791.1 hypothetical protein EV07_1232 [Prochlorococcus sp. MIT 0603]